MFLCTQRTCGEHWRFCAHRELVENRKLFVHTQNLWRTGNSLCTHRTCGEQETSCAHIELAENSNCFVHTQNLWRTVVVLCTHRTCGEQETLCAHISSICFRRDCDHDTTTMVAVPPNRICRHLTHLGLTLFYRSPSGPIREIEGIVTHICVTREMRAVFRDAYMRHQAKMS